jgi:hypothetical protein
LFPSCFRRGQGVVRGPYKIRNGRVTGGRYREINYRKLKS